MFRFLLSAAGALALVACGTSSTTDAFHDGTPTGSAFDDAGDDGATLASPSGAVDAAAPPASDAGGASRCDRLLSDVERLRSEALTCALNVPDQKQCNELVDDLCCKIVVTGGSQAVTNFEVAVKAFKASKCTVDCSKATCPTAPTYMCQPMSATKGTCQQ